MKNAPTNTSREVTILLVEDDEVDIEGIQRGFRKHKIANPFIIARNGVEALHLLKKGMPQPFIILLDLNMPQMNGIEFLEALRGNPDLEHNIVFVLTTSNDERDRWAAYEQHVAGYLLKSQVGKDFSRLISMLDLYWRYISFPPEPPFDA